MTAGSFIGGKQNGHGGLPASRLLCLFLLFYFICLGLGYPILNRIDWSRAPGGLQDVLTYADMVSGQPTPDVNQHMRFRVLIPYLARPVYRIALDHLGTWDPIMFALLTVNAFFVSLTVTILLLVVYRELGSYSVALGAAFVYLLNFAVPNLRLSGFIDAGEGLFLMLAIWSLVRNHYRELPGWGLLGATAKESFVPFFMIFTLSWWLSSRKELRRPSVAAAWMVLSWGAALASLAAVQFSLTHTYRSPLRFGLELYGGSDYLTHFLTSFGDRNFWYIFFWLLPAGLIRIRRLSLSWRLATGAASATAFALDAYYGGPPGAIGRALFSIAGPVLCASAALLLFGGVDGEAVTVSPSGR